MQAVPWYIWPTQMLSICSHKKLTAEEPEDGLVSRSSCIHTDSEVRSCHSLAQYWHSFLILYSEKVTVKTAAIVLNINLWFDNLMAIWALSHEIASNRRTDEAQSILAERRHCSLIHSEIKVRVTQNRNGNVNIQHFGLQTRPRNKCASISTIKMQILISPITSG